MGLDLFINITFQSIVLIGVGVLSFVMGALVYSRDVRRVDALSFFLLTWAFSLWAILLGVFESMESGDLEYIILILAYFFAALIPPVTLFFTMALSKEGKVVFKKTKISLGIGLFVFISYVISIPGFLFKDIVNTGEVAKEIVFGSGYLLFVLYIFIYSVVVVFLLFKKYRKSAGIFRVEIYYIFLSIFIGAVFILLVNIIFPYFGIYSFFWVGPIVGFLVIGIIGYLMIKYNFWNLKLAVTDLFTSLISLILLLELFLSTSTADFIIKVVILALVLLSGFFLVRSVRYETESREESEKLVKELAKVNDNLHLLDKQKSEFVANSAHHLRDPLTAIKGYSSLVLEESLGEISGEVREAVGRIYKSSQRLVVIINDFMDITKIESGEMDYVFSKVDFKKMLEDMMNEMTIAAKDSGLELTLNIDEPQDYCINADEGKVRQVVSNLVDNSIKYTPHGGIEISLSKSSDNKKIILRISDTGIGMSSETIKKIFHKFSRADEASKFHTGGSGLGLYIAKEILKKHRGRIWAESDGLGKGSEFFLEFKVV